MISQISSHIIQPIFKYTHICPNRLGKRISIVTFRNVNQDSDIGKRE